MTPPRTDPERFEALYRAHYAEIVRFVHRRIDASSAEEVVADTFATAWRRLADVPAEPLPWLYVVARNLLYGERRAAASSRDKATNLGLVATGQSIGRDPADALAERDHVLRAFLTLNEADREALRLVAWDGLDHRAAARVAGTTRVAFTMRVSRARRRLGAALTDFDAPATTPAPTPRIQEERT